ncbi:MAG: hypothetical protein QOI73_3629 [Solirubrobacteraceae bacterium]|jgi:FkbM family methyltransferase|nr:hypothetical protein [Solirubrobacteraceae bacterium]
MSRRDRAPAAERISEMARTLRTTPVAGRLLRVLRGPADRGLMALRRPPFKVAVDEGVLAGYLRHRAYVAHLSGGYEDFARQLFVQALRPGATVVDGGAHIGLYTLMSSARIGATGRVHAFEADPYNLAALRLNVLRNGLHNVDIVAMALSDRAGTSTYHVSSGTIASSLVSKRYVDDATEISVETTTIDAVLGSRPAPYVVVKLDVEGAEERVLRGAQRTLRTCAAGCVLAEHNPDALLDGGSSGSSIVELLRELGFTPHFIDERHRALTPICATGPPTQKGNLWATKGS